MRSLIVEIVDARSIVLIAALIGVCAAVARPVAHRLRWGWFATFAALASVVPIVTLTILNRSAAFPAVGFPDAVTWWRQGWDGLPGNAERQADWLLNVALFVPAGLAWTIATRRPLRVLFALVVGSFVVESVQGATGLGAPQVADLVANSGGAAVGVIIVVLWRSSARIPIWRGRRAGATASVAVVGAALLLPMFAVRAEADHRRDTLASELMHRFPAISAVEYRYWFGSDDGGEGFQDFMSTTSVRPDQVVYLDRGRAAEARYTITLYGIHRCVFVTFAPPVTGFRRGGGSGCTAFSAGAALSGRRGERAGHGFGYNLGSHHPGGVA